MTALEKVMQLKKEGKGEGEIIATLKAQGISPMEISEALNQSKIKEAIYDDNPTEGMMPSIMQTEEEQAQKPIQTQQTPPPQELYAPEPSSAPQPPQTQQNYQNYSPAPQQNYNAYQPQSYAPEQEYSQDGYANQNDYYQDYSGQEGYYDPNSYAAGGSTDTMIEVAEQVYAEKMKKLTKEIRDLTEFKTIFETKVENIKNRLERMEKYFDKMQIQILEKVGEYGKGLDYMRKELRMVEDTIGKISEKQ